MHEIIAEKFITNQGSNESINDEVQNLTHTQTIADKIVPPDKLQQLATSFNLSHLFCAATVPIWMHRVWMNQPLTPSSP